MLLSPQSTYLKQDLIFRALLLEASILMNSWAQATFSNAETLFFAPSLERHFQNVKKLETLDQVQSRKKKDHLSESFAQMSLTDIQDNPDYDKCYFSCLRNMSDLEYGYVVHPYLVNEKLPYTYAFQDHTTELKSLLQEIIAAAKKDIISITDLFAFVFLFKNLLIIVTEANRGSQPIKINNSKFIKLWLKFSIELIQILDSLETSNRFDSGQKGLLKNCKWKLVILNAQCAASLTALELTHARSELEYAYVEALATQAFNLHHLMRKSISDTTFLNTSLNEIYSIYLTIAHKNKDVARMVHYLDNINEDCEYSYTVTDRLLDVAKDKHNTEPTVALCYYQKALRILSRRKQPKNLLEKAWHMVEEHNIREIEIALDEIKRACTTKIKASIKDRYPTLKARLGKSASQLNVYIPDDLQNLPRGIMTRFKGFGIQIVDDKKFKGLGLVFNSLDKNEVLSILEQLLEKLKENRKPQPIKTQNEPKMEVAAIVEQNPITLKAEPKGLIESAPEKYAISGKAERVKTRAIGPMPAPTAATPPLAPIELHTRDFGFDVPGNPCITPVYCSKGAQQARRTKIYLRWEGIPDCDALVERQFQEMLNPHQEGILTVGTYGQAGAKLYKDPEGLGAEWGQCALRLKRKGAAGFLRVKAIPESHIVVTNEGITEHRYLFKLGKGIHK